MKKLTIIFIALGLFAYAQAQEEGGDEFVSKRGINILPETGDIALGINGIPIISYFGNTFNGTANNATSFNFVDGNNAIYFKYFLTETSAVRVRLRIGTGTITDLEYVSRDTLPWDARNKVEDIEKVSASNYNLGLGYEIRRGHGRVQGFFGGEFSVLATSGKTTYDYGNAYSAEITNPNYTNFGTNVGAMGRVIEQKQGTGLGFGLGGFMGVEYFFAPKISVGGEFGWGFAFTKTGDGTVTEEFFDANNSAISEETVKAGGGKAWGVDTDNAFGAIYLMFHF
ncbi:MAG: hypothetical protein ABIJ97_17575 [Bacteroidota bacterium]